jgi:hypothetical protein
VNAIEMVSISLVKQSVGFYAASCDRCGNPFDAGRAISANSPGICGSCAIQSEVADARDNVEKPVPTETSGDAEHTEER